LGQSVEFLELLPANLNVDKRAKDRPRWEWDPKRAFIVRNTPSGSTTELQYPFTKVMWKVRAPMMVGAFLWLVINKALLKWDNLMKRNW